MKHFFLILLLTGTLWAAQDSANQVTTKPPEKLLGSWKRVAGPDEPSTLKIEPEGGGVKISFGCKQDGSCQAVYVIGNYDGKPYKDKDVGGSSRGFRRTSNRTVQENGYSSGKPSTRVSWQLSPDEKTLTRTIHNIDPAGLKDTTAVYDRIGGPVSKDDAFLGFWKRDWNRGDALIVKYASKGDVFTFTDPRGVVHDRNCDDNDHPDTDSTPMMTGALYSCRFLDDRTYESASKRDGKVVSTITSKISEDGKKMVWTLRNAESKTAFEYTYEKMN
jgi:hypothetical protein